MKFFRDAPPILRDFLFPIICRLVRAGHNRARLFAQEDVHDVEDAVRRRRKNDELNVMETQVLPLPVTSHHKICSTVWFSLGREDYAMDGGCSRSPRENFLAAVRGGEEMGCRRNGPLIAGFRSPGCPQRAMSVWGCKSCHRSRREL